MTDVTDTDEAVDVAARFAAECITSADGTTAHLPVSLAHDVLAALAAADGGEVERLRAVADATRTFAERHGRFHPDHWLAGGVKDRHGRMQRCDACDLCAALHADKGPKFSPTEAVQLAQANEGESPIKTTTSGPSVGEPKRRRRPWFPMAVGHRRNGTEIVEGDHDMHDDAPTWRDDDALMDLAETAWGIIANANEGNWEQARPEWKDAAERWRERYHDVLKTHLSSSLHADKEGEHD